MGPLSDATIQSEFNRARDDIAHQTHLPPVAVTAAAMQYFAYLQRIPVAPAAAKPH